MEKRREKPIRAVLFDLDGTLLDSLVEIADAANETLARFGLAQYPVDSYRLFIGNGIETLMKRVVPASMRAQLGAPFIDTFRDLYLHNLNRKAKPYQGITTMLLSLTRQNIGLAVLSNKHDDLTKCSVSHFFPEIPFAAVFGERQGVARKPDPHAALEIAAILTQPPEQCMFIGDTAVDIQTGKAAGMFSVGVTWGFRDVQELESAHADWIINKPEELMRHADFTL